MDPNVFTIIAYSLTSDTLSPVDLKDIALYQITPLLTPIPGVARVEVQGGAVAEIQVLVDPLKLDAFGLALTDVSTAITNGNSLTALGKVEDFHKLYLVMSNNTMNESEQIRDTVVRADPRSVVRVRDVAEVVDGTLKEWVRTFADRKVAVLFQIYEQPDGNAVDIAGQVRDKLNEFAEVEMETHQPIYADPYVENRITGAFIVVEPISNETVAAGMFASDLQGRSEALPLPDRRAGQGMTLWFTGLSSSGKSTISKAVYEKLWAKGHKVELLDGDVVRQHLSKDLGFNKEGRDENIRRIGFMAELLTRNGVIVLVAAISPYREIRREIRSHIGNFVEVYVNAPLALVEQRDLTGLYRRYRAGEIHGVAGMDAPYEAPLTPEVECHTDRETLAESAEKVIRAVEDRLAGRA